MTYADSLRLGHEMGRGLPMVQPLDAGLKQKTYLGPP